jgi:SAM-dependent methyltransferase
MLRATSARLPGRSKWSRAIATVKTFATKPSDEPLRPVPCALCGAEGLPSAFARLWSCEGFSFVRCRGCGLVQQNPQSESAAVASRYDGAYLRYEEANQFAYRDLELMALHDLGLDGLASPLFSRALEAGRRPRVLDVGCSTGALLAALREKGWDAQGVEISPEQARYGEEHYGLPIFAGSLEAAAFPSAAFELVHASHLIEHLNEPGAFLDEVSRVLAPGGLVILTTPNVDGLQARLLGARWRSAIYDHLYLFSLRTLRSLLVSHGFSIDRSITWGGWARGLRPGFIKRPMDRLAKRCGFGDVVAVLARKA